MRRAAGRAVSIGSSCAQRSWAIGQRVRNRQPAGIRSGLGGSPITAGAPSPVPGVIRGIAASRPRV